MRPPSPRAAHLPPLPATADLVVVGAGVVGLAHALEAHARGHSVLVVERDPRPAGASARRSGHVAVTTQDAATLSCALASRERWLKLGREAGFWVKDTGAVVVARSADELAVLDDLVAARDGDAQLLGAAQAAERAHVAAQDVVGGAFLPLDLRIDPRDALRSLATALDSRPRADVAWSTTALTFEAGTGRTLVRTSRGEVVARRALVAVGPDLDRFFPDEAARAGLRHDVRQVLRVATPARHDPAGPAVLGGTTLLRDAASAHSPALADVRERLRTDAPELLDAGVHLALTPHGDTLLLGEARRTDADRRDDAGHDRDPERSETADALLLREARALLGRPVEVRQRWSVPDVAVPRPRRGPFAGTPFVVTDPAPGVTTVTVADGLGTTTALGLAAKVVDGLL
ncbi:FAD-dependent oxidoreductase [Krasilnikoviella flava]|uniref:FAD dependent oxidoreductase TIGR03364 n=1 Tax=Krasilnikoviella flava TaxID=526729 RepID=A0A1T5LKM7_9MICO|nr:FAD-dependent oxidoreductase [Krasilnikoviella flava]SKC76547.1 FAD dependent oxidoreductase TIGR03364 [Krasilnikoviella flava]